MVFLRARDRCLLLISMRYRKLKRSKPSRGQFGTLHNLICGVIRGLNLSPFPNGRKVSLTPTAHQHAHAANCHRNVNCKVCVTRQGWRMRVTLS